MNVAGCERRAPNDWTVRAAQCDDDAAIVRLIYADPGGDSVKILGTTERALLFGAAVSSAWSRRSCAVSTVVEAQGAVVAVLQDGSREDEFDVDLSFLRQVTRELGFPTLVRLLHASIALQSVRISLPGDSWLIHELHVDSCWRNRGIGTLLLELASDRGIERGYASTALTTRTNNPARRLYERLGYHVVARRTSRLYAHFTGSEGRVLMTKAL